jgi:hypothetical protein
VTDDDREDAVTDRSTSRWWVLLTLGTLLVLLALIVHVSK